jgi:CRISPR/Cas system-associated exonuclease Cas4 (RecB family)
MLGLINDGDETKQLASFASKQGEINSPLKIEPNKEENCPQFNINNDLIDENQKALSPFNVDLFAKEVWKKSDEKGRTYSKLTQNISGYDIAHNCIAMVVYKLLNTPIKSFASKWLPIMMRGVIGTAIHDFIQGTSNQFTELEPTLKVPSIRYSGRLDALIGNNILVEIKSCTYSDYSKIIKKQKPRNEDFYQCMTYKYILENHLNEAKTADVKRRTQPPALDVYDIDTIQLIYIAHDLSASDVEDFGLMLKKIKQIKKTLNSKSNSFFFMTTLTINLTEEISKPYIDFVHDKINRINWYVKNNKIPGSDDPYVNKKCFFCLYKDICQIS